MYVPSREEAALQREGVGLVPSTSLQGWDCRWGAFREESISGRAVNSHIPHRRVTGAPGKAGPEPCSRTGHTPTGLPLELWGNDPGFRPWLWPPLAEMFTELPRRAARTGLAPMREQLGHLSPEK